VKKVWWHTYWLTWGPVQRSIHSPIDRQPLIQRAWMRSVAPPYYRGVGVGLRLGRNTLSVGVCYPMGMLTRPDTDDVIMEAVFGRHVDKAEEGQWDSSSERSA
jgi:hypothetical protein